MPAIVTGTMVPAALVIPAPGERPTTDLEDQLTRAPVAHVMQAPVGLLMMDREALHIRVQAGLATMDREVLLTMVQAAPLILGLEAHVIMALVDRVIQVQEALATCARECADK